MREHPRLRKLLETATHSTASTGERINALDAFRRIAERHGGLDTIFSTSLDSGNKLLLDQALKEVARLKDDNVKLRAERDELLEQKREREKCSDRSTLLDSIENERKVIASLSQDWQELHRIHESAKKKGYAGNSATTSTILNSLYSSGKVVLREPGVYSDRNQAASWRAKSWRLR